MTNDPQWQWIKYPTDNEKKHIVFSGAWHMDAGDYSIYTYNASMFVWNLLFALDILWDKIAYDNLNIPESWNWKPDLYDEMIKDLLWLEWMQDDDGWVFGMSKPKWISYQNWKTWEDPNLKRYLTPKDTPHTASFVAVMARASRSKIIKKYNPELQEEFKQRAEKAWNWLESTTQTWSSSAFWHHYWAREWDIDDRVWASIELYALTWKEKYYNYFNVNRTNTFSSKY